MQNFDPINLMKSGLVPNHASAIHVRIPQVWFTHKNEKIIVNDYILSKMIFELNDLDSIGLGPDRFPRIVRAAVFQCEKGEEGNIHFQITLFLTKRIYLSDIRKKWKLGSSTTKFYVKEVEDPLKSMLYCSKQKTRFGETHYIYDDQNTLDIK